MPFDYINNTYAKTWLNANMVMRRGVFTPLAFIDICGGNRYDADTFAQIMYWHEPSIDGETKMRRVRDGHYWVTKNHADWFKETRINKRTVRDCLERLKKSGLIFFEVHGEVGLACPWIRVNWDEFEAKMNLWMEIDFSNQDNYTEKVAVFETPLRQMSVPPREMSGTPTADVISNTEITHRLPQSIARPFAKSQQAKRAAVHLPVQEDDGVQDGPEYVDEGDEFGETRQRPKWQIPYVNDEELMRAMKACGRKFFKSRSERTTWKDINNRIVAGLMTPEWLNNCIEFAESKQIPFPNLLSYIMNAEKMVDWEQKNKKGAPTEALR